ncbi:MAG: hypothetical protein LBU32_04395 [Clostridiales bacterium]|jgi:hypothetical protein|nr:hypothetical protein [Clostridiales bacterium]
MDSLRRRAPWRDHGSHALCGPTRKAALKTAARCPLAAFCLPKTLVVLLIVDASPALGHTEASDCAGIAPRYPESAISIASEAGVPVDDHRCFESYSKKAYDAKTGKKLQNF